MVLDFGGIWQTIHKEGKDIDRRTVRRIYLELLGCKARLYHLYHWEYWLARAAVDQEYDLAHENILDQCLWLLESGQLEQKWQEEVEK